MQCPHHFAVQRVFYDSGPWAHWHAKTSHNQTQKSKKMPCRTVIRLKKRAAPPNRFRFFLGSAGLLRTEDFVPATRNLEKRVSGWGGPPASQHHFSGHKRKPKCPVAFGKIVPGEKDAPCSYHRLLCDVVQRPERGDLAILLAMQLTAAQRSETWNCRQRIAAAGAGRVNREDGWTDERTGVRVGGGGGAGGRAAQFISWTRYQNIKKACQRSPCPPVGAGALECTGVLHGPRRRGERRRACVGLRRASQSNAI
eukprot:gene17729-biopygen20399